MPRWEPDTRARLVRAAVDLFTTQGYEATTLNEIVGLAGLTKPTFFRHFRDKREILFAGQEEHTQILADTVATAAGGGALDVAGLGLKALTDRFTPDRREFNVRLSQVIGQHQDLQERWTYKRAALAEALRDALIAKGFSDAVAGITADLTIRAFYEAYRDWLEPATTASLTSLATRHLAAAKASLDQLAT